MDNFPPPNPTSHPTLGTMLSAQALQSFLSRHNYTQEPPTSCLICYLEKPLKRLTPCSHYFCETCIKSYLEIKISESEVLNIACPECSSLIPELAIKENVSSEFFSKYLKFTEIRRLETDVMVKWCPKADCTGYDRAYISNHNLTCNTCGQQFCYVCSRPWHRGKCRLHNDLGFDLWTLTNNVKICPNCKNYVQKNGGCTHMSCPRCLYHWCWICGRDYGSESHTAFTCLLGRNLFDLYWLIIFLMIFFPLTLPFFVLLLVMYSYENETVDKERFTGIFSCFRSRFVVYVLAFIFSPVIEILGLAFAYFALIGFLTARKGCDGGVVGMVFKVVVFVMLGNSVFVTLGVILAFMVVIVPVLGLACLVSKVVLRLGWAKAPQQGVWYPGLFG